jgi:hypothetical protein
MIRLLMYYIIFHICIIFHSIIQYLVKLVECYVIYLVNNLAEISKVQDNIVYEELSRYF